MKERRVLVAQRRETVIDADTGDAAVSYDIFGGNLGGVREARAWLRSQVGDGKLPEGYYTILEIRKEITLKTKTTLVVE